jgi:hypothetical protein
MTSNKNELLQSIILTLLGASLGLQLGSKIGEYLDTQVLERSGMGLRSYHYWDMRLGILGSIIGLIFGAIGAYVYALSQKKKYGQ